MFFTSKQLNTAIIFSSLSGKEHRKGESLFELSEIQDDAGNYKRANASFAKAMEADELSQYLNEIADGIMTPKAWHGLWQRGSVNIMFFNKAVEVYDWSDSQVRGWAQIALERDGMNWEDAKFVIRDAEIEFGVKENGTSYCLDMWNHHYSFAGKSLDLYKDKNDDLVFDKDKLPVKRGWFW